MWLINGGQASLPVGKSMLRTDVNYGDPGCTFLVHPRTCPGTAELNSTLTVNLSLIFSPANDGADMSAQQICDCMGVSCCTGGWPESALQYVQLNGGLSAKDNYQYTASINVSVCDMTEISLDSMVRRIAGLRQ